MQERALHNPAPALAPEEMYLQNWDFINRLARARFRDENLADEAVIFVHDQLRDSNWKRMTAFEQRSSFKTYLAHVVRRLLEDFARNRFGRKRAPLWIDRLGGVWKELFTLLCIESLSVLQAVQSVCSRSGAAESDFLMDCAAQIVDKVKDCGTVRGPDIPLEDAALETLASAAEHPMDNPEDICSATQSSSFMQALRAVLDISDEQEELTDPGTVDHFRHLLSQSLRIDAEGRLLLRLVFEEGLSVSDAGRRLGLNAGQTHGRMRRLQAHIREGITAALDACRDHKDASILAAYISGER